MGQDMVSWWMFCNYACYFFYFFFQFYQFCFIYFETFLFGVHTVGIICWFLFDPYIILSVLFIFQIFVGFPDILL